jgi:hypothetical protein
VPHAFTTAGQDFVADAGLAPVADTVTRIESVKELLLIPHDTPHVVVAVFAGMILPPPLITDHE